MKSIVKQKYTTIVLHLSTLEIRPFYFYVDSYGNMRLASYKLQMGSQKVFFN